MAGGRLTSKLAKWRRWLAIVRADLDSLVDRRVAHRAARTSLQAASDPDLGTYLDELRSQSIALGIRRQLKIDSKSINLAGLIRDLEAVLGSGGGGAATTAGSSYSSHDSCMPLDRRIGGLVSELQRLDAMALPVQRYADRRLAHADKRPNAAAPQLDRLEAVLDELVALWQHASTVVDAAGRQTESKDD